MTVQRPGPSGERPARRATIAAVAADDDGADDDGAGAGLLALLGEGTLRRSIDGGILYKANVKSTPMGYGLELSEEHAFLTRRVPHERNDRSCRVTRRASP